MKTVFILFFACFLGTLHAQSVITGRVLTDTTALPGAVIKVKGTATGVTADEKGNFRLEFDGASAHIQVSYIGFVSTEMIVIPGRALTITLQPDANQLGEVVISTGYQHIPRERSTGSFSTVDNVLLSRRVSPDILSRLDDTMPGLITNKGRGGAQGLLIRGQSTINSASSPLIIIDNFPYEGDISTLNPNDVESVTVLKDAAAASIWGSRAGNGVIVITTKKGVADQGPQISFNSNLTVSQKPDIYYQPRISSSDYIDNELRLFESGRYGSAERSASKLPFTPVVELLMAARDKSITSEQARAEIDKLRGLDVRSDYERYLYRPAVNQQYALSIRGASGKNRYFISTGYDKGRAFNTGNDNQRFTLNINNSFQLSSKLELSAGLYYARARNNANSQGPVTYTNPLSGFSGAAIYPYAQLADPAGAPLPLINQFRLSYLRKAEQTGAVDWDYRPLQELQLADNRTRLTDYRINATLNYQIAPGMSFSTLYQYGNGDNAVRNHYSQQTYMARNLINRFTSVDENGVISRNVPLGGVLDRTQSGYSSHNVRGQLDLSKSFTDAHQLTAIAGFELRDLGKSSASYRTYGYDDNFATGKAVNYITPFVSFVNPASTIRIPYAEMQSEETDRYLSYYANAGYTLKNRYTLSASARLDQSNLFGVDANDKGVPLYSAGASWSISKEGFYRLAWLPVLKLRGTFGYSGNSNKNVSALTTASFGSRGDLNTGATYATIQNPPNPGLRWEKVRTINLGVDFQTTNRTISGSLEYYHKKGMDLIGSMPYPGSSGVKLFTGNYAATRSGGLDLILDARIINSGLQWSANFLLSHVAEKVTRYDIKSLAAFYINSGDGISIYPLQGKPLYAVYSMPWAGLDPANGDPQGYLNGEVSKDYAAMLNMVADDMVYHGPARPVFYGALRNTLSWKSLSLSVNTNYRMGHYYRTKSVSYTEMNTGLLTHGDFSRRWQKPGDEQLTSVPSMPASPNVNRESFYSRSSALVKKADHVRLQDINLSYRLSKSSMPGLPFHSAHLYLYASNLGIIWKSSDGPLDPDYAYSDFVPPASLSAGIKLDF